jgi:hypothetical protein
MSESKKGSQRKDEEQLNNLIEEQGPVRRRKYREGLRCGERN